MQVVLGEAETVQNPGLAFAVGAAAVPLQRGLAVAGGVAELAFHDADAAQAVQMVCASGRWPPFIR